MEIKKYEKTKDNGSYEKITIIKTQQEDGWNNVDEIFGTAPESKTRLFKGKSKTIQYVTNDPQITRKFTWIASVIGVLMGIILLVLGIIFKLIFMLFFGIMLLITIISFFISSQKEINKIEKEIKKY